MLGKSIFRVLRNELPFLANCSTIQHVWIVVSIDCCSITSELVSSHHDHPMMHLNWPAWAMTAHSPLVTWTLNVPISSKWVNATFNNKLLLLNLHQNLHQCLGIQSMHCHHSQWFWHDCLNKHAKEQGILLQAAKGSWEEPASQIVVCAPLHGPCVLHFRTFRC